MVPAHETTLRVPPRNLRHTFGTLAIKAGTDISVVARQLGTLRHPNHRKILFEARSERPQGHAESMATTCVDLLNKLSVTLERQIWHGFVVIKAGILMLLKFSGAISATEAGMRNSASMFCRKRIGRQSMSTACAASRMARPLRMLIVQANCIIRVANMGSTGSSQSCVGTVVYPIC